MRGTEPLALHESLGVGADAAHLVGDRLVVGPDHHRKPCVCARRRGVQHMREQRLSRYRVQHFGQAGAHPRALAGREHDCQARSCSQFQFPNFIGAVLERFPARKRLVVRSTSHFSEHFRELNRPRQ